MSEPTTIATKIGKGTAPREVVLPFTYTPPSNPPTISVEARKYFSLTKGADVAVITQGATAVETRKVFEFLKGQDVAVANQRAIAIETRKPLNFLKGSDTALVLPVNFTFSPLSGFEENSLDNATISADNATSYVILPSPDDDKVNLVGSTITLTEELDYETWRKGEDVERAIQYADGFTYAELFPTSSDPKYLLLNIEAANAAGQTLFKVKIPIIDLTENSQFPYTLPYNLS